MFLHQSIYKPKKSFNLLICIAKYARLTNMRFLQIEGKKTAGHQHLPDLLRELLVAWGKKTAGHQHLPDLLRELLVAWKIYSYIFV